MAVQPQSSFEVLATKRGCSIPVHRREITLFEASLLKQQQHLNCLPLAKEPANFYHLLERGCLQGH